MKQNKQRTVLVVYADCKLTKKEHQTLKRYAFNTSSNINVGMHLKLDLYATPVQVVEVMPKSFKYIDSHSGALSDRRVASTRQYEIREIELVVKKSSDIIKATIYDEEADE
jgi:hypothetical protein